MDPQTLGHGYNAGRIVPVRCVKGDHLQDVDTKDSCFLLIIIYEGTALFEIGLRCHDCKSGTYAGTKNAKHQQNRKCRGECGKEGKHGQECTQRGKRDSDGEEARGRGNGG